jgi:hypothetical protein
MPAETPMCDDRGARFGIPAIRSVAPFAKDSPTGMSGGTGDSRIHAFTHSRIHADDVAAQQARGHDATDRTTPHHVPPKTRSPRTGPPRTGQLLASGCMQRQGSPSPSRLRPCMHRHRRQSKAHTGIAAPRFRARRHVRKNKIVIASALCSWRWHRSQLPAVATSAVAARGAIEMQAGRSGRSKGRIARPPCAPAHARGRACNTAGRRPGLSLDPALDPAAISAP